MAQEFYCKECGKNIIVHYVSGGEVAQCKQCGAENIVPESGRKVIAKKQPSENRRINNSVKTNTKSPSGGTGNSTSLEFKGLEVSQRNVRVRGKGGGEESFRSIMLEHVTSCGVYSKKSPALVVIAVICLVVGVAIGDKAIIVGAIVGGIFLLAYFFGGTKSLMVASPSTEIYIVIGGRVSMEKVVSVVDHIEGAIDRRRRDLRG